MPGLAPAGYSISHRDLALTLLQQLWCAGSLLEHMRAMRTLHRLMAITVVGSLAACTGEVGGEDLPTPVLLAISSKTVTVGAPLDFIGANFMNRTKSGHTEIRFKGEFHADSGKTYAVDYRLKPRWADGNRVVWPF